MKIVYNQSSGHVEVAHKVPCRRCRGVGFVAGEHGEKCSRCAGHGKHWQTSGFWTVPLWGRKGRLI